MKRRPRRTNGEFVKGDVVVVKSWKFKVGGVRSETERRIGFFVGPLFNITGHLGVYCPVGGWVFVEAGFLSRATAAQERAFCEKWDGLLRRVPGGGR